MSTNKDFDNVIRCLSNNTQGVLCCQNDEAYLRELTLYFSSLKPSQKRPDAYAIQGNNLLLLEHFQFDNTRITRKGSNQNRISAETQRAFQKSFEEGNDFAVLSESVSKNGQYYIENFRRQFNKHAQNIQVYKMEMQKELNREFDDCLMGFIIEDASPLGSGYHNGKLEYVDLTFSKEFLDLFENTANLDFVVFAMTGNENHKILSFISRQCINLQRTNQIEVSKIGNFLFENSFCVSAIIN